MVGPTPRDLRGAGLPFPPPAAVNSVRIQLQRIAFHSMAGLLTGLVPRRISESAIEGSRVEQPNHRHLRYSGRHHHWHAVRLRILEAIFARAGRLTLHVAGDAEIERASGRAR